MESRGMNERNEKAVTDLRAYFRALDDGGDRTSFYYSVATDYADGRLDLAEIVRVVRAALAAPPPPAKTEEEK